MFTLLTKAAQISITHLCLAKIIFCNIFLLSLSFSPSLLPSPNLYYNMTWPQYELDNQTQWPENRVFDFQILTNLDDFCQLTG